MFLLECILKLIAFKPKVRVIATVVQSHYKKVGGGGERGGEWRIKEGTEGWKE